jgi:DNA replication protein
MTKNAFSSAVDFRYALLDSYKRLNISEDELAVILMIDLLSKQGNVFITADMLSLKMNLKPAEIDKAMVGLVNRNFLAFETGKEGMRTSLDGLKAVYGTFQKTIEREQANLLSKDRADRLSALSKFFEENLARSLSPLESQTMADWLEAGYSDEEIKGALLDCLRERKRSVRAVDKLLRAKRIDHDLAKEGASAVTENWDKDIDSTVQIAKSLWGEGHGKK